MFILEGGTNHLGKLYEAKKIVNFFLKSSFNKLTFMCQTQNWYQKKLSRNQNFKLPIKFYNSLIKLSHKKNKQVGLSICDLETYNELKDVKFDFYKLLSISINNYDLIDELNRKNKKIYVSTGFNASEKMIRNCLKHLKRKKNITLLHTPMVKKYEDLNFSRINYLKKKFNLDVGYSNHFFDLKTLNALTFYKPKAIMIYVKPSRRIKTRYPDHNHAAYFNELGKIKIDYENIFKCHGKYVF